MSRNPPLLKGGGLPPCVFLCVLCGGSPVHVLFRGTPLTRVIFCPPRSTYSAKDNNLKGSPTNPCSNADRNARGNAEDDHGRKEMVGGGQPADPSTISCLLCSSSGRGPLDIPVCKRVGGGYPQKHARAPLNKARKGGHKSTIKNHACFGGGEGPPL